jgi:hypothetical protein
MTAKCRFPVYGYIGLGIMGLSEIFMSLDFRPVSGFFTPIVWTGYILIADAWLVKSSRPSLIRRYGSRFFSLCVYSVFFWMIFEYYNFFIRNWYYQGLPDRYALRMFGYLWSYATVLPGILITSELVKLHPLVPTLCQRRIRFTSRFLDTCVLAGILMMAWPLMFPSPYVFAPVWLGIIFLLDPINYKLGKVSLVRDFERGEWSNFFSVLVGGYICGFLWEFWNYWAHTRWVYTVPILPQIRVFEMPVLGFLGFGPFALECYVATNLLFSKQERYHGELTEMV